MKTSDLIEILLSLPADAEVLIRVNNYQEVFDAPADVCFSEGGVIVISNQGESNE